MDLEFSMAQKTREKEKKQRVEEAVRKRAAEDKKKRVAIEERERIDKITQERKQREAEQREVEEDLRLKEEARTGGIKYCKLLKAFPTAGDGERITLPPSALESLEAQSAIDPSRPLTFEVCVLDEVSGNVLSTTHVGVAEFTAEEHTVGIPPKTVLSLTKERGGSLNNLRVKYVKLPMPAKSFVRLQPRKEGFHSEGAEVVSLDLKAVLERELSRHTAISKGDWLPIRHEKVSYELVVVNLEPCDSLSLVNTDLEVDLLPSERAQHDQEKRARMEEQTAAAALKVAMDASTRSERAEEMRGSLPEEVAADTPSAITLLVRMPQGGQCSRRFLRSDPLSAVFAWVGCQVAVVESGMQSLKLIMNYPKRVLTASEMTLADAGLTGKREALFLSGEGGAEVTVDNQEGEESMEIDEEALSEEWADAATLQKEKFDRQLSDEGKAQMEEGPVKPSGDKVAVFHMLVADGFGKVQAASVAQRFGDSIAELYNMGFANHRLNVELLERYGGRMLRVVNALSERPAEEPPQAVQSPPVQAARQPVSQDSFQTKFTELVSGGMPPNEAAAQALLLLTPETVTPAVASVTASKWQAELAELSAMGFWEEERNIDLLERYQGRLVRVVNTLAGE